MFKTNKYFVKNKGFRKFSSEVKHPSNRATEWQNAKPLSEMPTLKPLKLLWNLLPGGVYSKLDTFQLMLAVKRDIGSICWLRGAFGNPDFVMTHNPQDFEKAFRNEGPTPMRPGFEYLSYYRNVVKPDIFQGVEGLLGSICIFFRIQQIRNPRTQEVPATFVEEIHRWAVESVGVIALDHRLDMLSRKQRDATAERLIESIMTFFECAGELEFKPTIWKYYKTPTFKKLIKSLDGITTITKIFIDQAVEEIKKECKTPGVENANHKTSVLKQLIKIDKNIAMVMAMDMFLAGVDTTTTLFAGILLCLAKNPEKQEKLRNEIFQLLPQKDSELRENHLNCMPYLRACLKESLRLHPLAVGNARAQANNVVLSGYRVPKGSLVSMIHASIVRDAKYYPQPDAFLPERWLRQPRSENNVLKSKAPFQYLPFGFGPRSCIGRRISQLELELVIVRLIRNFRVEFIYSTEKAFRGAFISVPNIPLRFKFIDIEE
ncbi:cytochrome P450 CYP12A2-like isoform X2 [Musca domestica]|uniref:Cytochrome P450 CYP12A2-like isoform X2 n=1 Tax=Musca domestica TaxID=7370 RepID=A0ABM3UX12_MUSDO|nr:cytochrome P450 CYP12A2-like isoform X2 [Musca domestica]